MNAFRLILIASAVVSFFFVNLFLAATFYKYIRILPSFSISEAPTYKYPTFNPSKVKVIPGSLVVFISKDAPFFTYLPSKPKLYHTIGLYFLTISLVSIILAVAFAINDKTYTHAILSGVFISIAVTFFILSVLFLSPAEKGDLICYTPPDVPVNMTICHTLIDIKDHTLILLRHYDNQTERVPVEWVVGKIVLIIPPPWGSVFYIFKTIVDIFSTLYSLIAQGQIPVGYSIKYIKVV